MFIWDFSVIIALGSAVFLGCVIAWWLFYINKNRLVEKSCDWQALKQCPYCAHVFLDYLHAKGLACPRCHSYLDDIKG